MFNKQVWRGGGGVMERRLGQMSGGEDTDKVRTKKWTMLGSVMIQTGP